MAKIILLTLSILVVQITHCSVFAAHGPGFQNLKLDACTAPAPDSFRITSIGSHFISLAWEPAWVGATHTLAVFEADGSGGWTSLDTIPNMPGSYYMVNNLQSGKTYRFIIATHCPNGEISALTSIIDGITLIIDLAIAGRNPVKPVAVDCNNIPLNNNWVGFKVEYASAGISISNLFELSIVGSNLAGNNFFSHVQIRRVFRDHPIVAIDEHIKWPTCNDPVRFDVEIPFRMARLFGSGPQMELIGMVNLIQNANSSVSICPDYFNPTLPWKNAYTFTALVAPKATELPGCEGRSDINFVVYADFKAQSPFDETLRVFFPRTFETSEKINVRLLNTKGQMILERQIEMITSEIAFPLGTLNPGIYILQIEKQGEIQTLKVIKV